MCTRNITKKNINEIADAIINEIKAVKDPFDTTTIVFHNMITAQWFKAYYLKHNKEVMMNIDFKTLAVFINDLVNPEGTYTIMDNSLLREYVLRIMSDNTLYPKSKSGTPAPTDYIFCESGDIDGSRLYEFADKMSTLFLQYENDCEEFTGWERTLYDQIMDLAAKDNCFTTKHLYEKVGSARPIGKVYILDNSYITALFKKILDNDKSDNITLLSIENTIDDFAEQQRRLVSAPSILREVEGLHSYVCKLVKANKCLRFNDFVVYVRNISNYAGSIRRVFEQDDKDFPSIPFSIVGESKEKTDMEDSLSILLDIANKGFFTRKDFYDFVNNPIIKYVNRIDDADITEWVSIISKTNTYRNRPGDDDWDYFKKRVLIASLVSESSSIENRATIGGQEYLPASSIGLNEERTEKMIDIIEYLEEWTELFENINCFKKAELEELQRILDKIYSIKNSDGEETNYLYREVSDELKDMISIQDSIPASAALSLLLDAPSRYSICPSDMFVRGVTFVEFSSDNIVSADYVYMLGMSSKNFPKTDARSELDISRNHISNKIIDERSLFNACAGAGCITFSYVNSNLQKDEMLFPAEQIVALCGGTGSEIRIPLDETRDYAELYTRKEFKAKDYAINRKAAHKSTAAIASTKRTIDSYERDSELCIKDIKKFLCNAYTYKFEKLMGKEYSNGIETAYEPIDVNRLQQYNVVKEMINGGATKTAAKERVRMTNSLPKGALGDAYFDYLYDDNVDIVQKTIASGYTPVSLDPLELIATDKAGADHKWNTICDIEIYRKESEADIYYLEAIGISANSWRYYFNMYAFSLMDIAVRNNEVEYSVHLGTPENEAVYKINSEEARELLNHFYLLMTDYEEIRYMDIDFLVTEDPTKLPMDLNSMINAIKEHTSWNSSFSDKGMIDPLSDLGYDEGSFGSEFDDYREEIKGLVIFENIEVSI